MKAHLKISSIALALTTAPVLAQTNGSATAPQVQDTQMALQQPGRWVQDYTGRKADPAVVFGTLPNGMRYAIMRNTTPSDGIAMRLRLGSGSLQENDEQQGLAHFLEHMAFRGSKNIADGEVVRMLERLGLRFGPDTNASTSQDQTVYMFNFPKADAAALETGLTLFREIGERLNLEPKLVEAEKGVLLSEERVRDVPQFRMAKANLGNALAGTRAMKRWPIGTVETIKAATSERLRAYYEANYRPNNATLIVVGNIEPARIEAQIKKKFDDWKPAGRPLAFDLGSPDPTEMASEFVGDGVPDALSLNWVNPVDRRADTLAREREQIVRFVALTVLNARISERATKPGSPFVAGQAVTITDFMDSAAITQIGIAAAPEKWASALDAIIEEQRQAVASPIAAAELGRAKAQVLAFSQSAADGAPTQTSEAIAEGLVRSVNEDELYTSPAQDLELVKAVLSDLTPQAVLTAMKEVFAGKGPVLFRSAQKEPLGVRALEAQLSASYAKPLVEREGELAVVWPYGDFGSAGKVVAQTHNRDLDATTAVFANGTRLIVKQTSFEKDRIHINVAIGNGRAGASEPLIKALWATGLMTMGGTGKLPATDIQRWSNSGGKLVNAQLQAGNRAFNLVAVTRPADLASEMQLLAAYARDPGFRPELGDQLGAIAPMAAGQIEANPIAVFEREIGRLFGGGNGRFNQIPSQSDIASTKPGDLPALLRTELTGPADVTMVGDVDVATAVAIVRSTFGAGRAMTRPTTSPVSLTMPQGRDAPYVVTHAGRPDQAFYGALWPIPDYRTDPAVSHVAEVTAAILETRMVETVREKLGLTYSPKTLSRTSIQLPGQGYFRVSIETLPSNFEVFDRLLRAELTNLASSPVSIDELNRSRKPLVETSLKRRESNAWWTETIANGWREPLYYRWMNKDIQGLRKVTAAQVQAFAKKFLAQSKPVVIISRAK